MTSITWSKGSFGTFRATREIALPADVSLEKLRKDEVVYYDGSTMKTEDGEEYKLPQLKGCFEKSWLVPASDVDAEYVPQAAGVQVHPATQMGNEKTAKAKMLVSHDDLREVGKVGEKVQPEPVQAKPQPKQTAPRRLETRPKWAPRISARAKKMIREFDLLWNQWSEEDSAQEVEAAPDPDPTPEPVRKSPIRPRMPIIVEEATSFRETAEVETREAVAPASAEGVYGLDAVTSGGGEAIRNTEAQVSQTPHFSGADSLSEVSVGSGAPRQVVAARTNKGQARAGKIAMDVDAMEQDGVPIAKLSAAKKRTTLTDSSQARMEANRLDNTPMGKRTKFAVTASNPEDAGEVVGSVGEASDVEFDEPETEPEETLLVEDPAVEITPETKQKLDAIRMFVPDFAWDMTKPWKTRVLQAVKLKDKPGWIQGILAIETEDVKRHIQAKLKGKGKAKSR